jgi:nucleoside-diphosphate-sugar epimerase
MPKTLVTGAPGWLGTRLVRNLIGGLSDVPGLEKADRELPIRCLVRTGIDASPLRAMGESIQVVEGDLRDPVSLKTFCRDAEGGTLFHCAGLIHPARRVKELYEVNVDGTRALLQTAEEAGVRRAAIVSSNSPIGTNPGSDHLFDEASPYNPYMNYGRSKMLMEQEVHQFQARGKLETVIVRPPWFYGPDQPPRQTLFFTMIKNGSAPIVGDGESRRSMAFVDNICQGLLLCESVPSANGQTYWIADRRPYTMNQIVDTVERLLETEFDIPVAHKRLKLPYVAGEVAMWMDAAIQGVGLYQQKIHVLSEMNKTIACTIQKAEEELGYDPKVELEEGMRRSIHWCLDEGLKI